MRIFVRALLASSLSIVLASSNVAFAQPAASDSTTPSPTPTPTPTVPAPTPTDPEQLFAQGSALMGEGKFAEALPLLTSAQKQDPGVGTLFNIAVCMQNLGRLGSAYRNFREVATLARASGKKAREEAARAKLAEVMAVAPAIQIVSDGAAQDVTIRVDGETIKREDWAYYPLDGAPGEGDHTIEATAPAKKPWSTKAPTPAGGVTQLVTVPALVRERVTVTREVTNPYRTTAYIFGGVAVAAGITWAVTWRVMEGYDDDARALGCPLKSEGKPGTCPEEARQLVESGKALSPINQAAGTIGLVSLGGGVVFFIASFLRSPPSPSRQAATANQPKASPPSLSFTPTTQGAMVYGSF